MAAPTAGRGSERGFLTYVENWPLTWEDWLAAAGGELVFEAVVARRRDEVRAEAGPLSVATRIGVALALGCSFQATTRRMRRAEFPAPAGRFFEWRVWDYEAVESHATGRPLPPPRTVERGRDFLLMADVAARIGLSRNTLAAYGEDIARVPPRAGRIGNVPYWLSADIEHWSPEQRAGRRVASRG